MKKIILFAILLFTVCNCQISAMAESLTYTNTLSCGNQNYNSDIRNTIESFSEKAIVNLADITGLAKESRQNKQKSSLQNWNSTYISPTSSRHNW